MGKTSPLATLTLAILFLALSGTNPAIAGQQTGCCQCDQCASGLVECMDVTGGQPQCDAFCASRDCALAGFTLEVDCADVTPCEQDTGAIMASTMSWPLIVGLSIFLAGLGIVYVRRRNAAHAPSDTPQP